MLFLNVFAVSRLLLAILLVVLVSACGGSLEDIDVPDPEDDDTEETEPVTVTLLVEGNETLHVIDRESKRLEVLTNSDDYFQLLDRYTSAQVEAVDFGNAQVLLYDAGDVETGNCVDRLELRQVSAEEVVDTSVVRVILAYDEVAATASGVNCPEQPVFERPFGFYLIQSTAKAVIVERLR